MNHRSFLRAAHARSRLLTLTAGLLLGLALAAPVHAAFLTRVEARPQARGAAIALSGFKLRGLAVSAFVLATPPRLILDLESASLAAGVPREFDLRLPGVTRARLRQFHRGPDIARLVLDLAPGTRAPKWSLQHSAQANELLLVLEPAGPLTLQPPQVEQHPKAWVVRIPGVGYLEHNVGALEHPTRIFLDFTNAEVPASSGRSFDYGPIRGVRLGQQPPAGETPVARVAIELRDSQSFAEEVDNGDLVLSFKGRPDALTYDVPSATFDVPADPGTYDVPDDPGTYDVPLPPQGPASALQGAHIVVDPGHGNGDCGAQWAGEKETFFESAITWAIASQLVRQLEAAGATVTLTHTDVGPYLRPGKRAQFANGLSPDAYISLHCNSCLATDDSASGTSVYYGHERSRALAEAVQEELVKEWGTQDRGIIQNSYLTVINATNCPSILVETAFIDNEEDRALLTDPDAQQRGAAAMLRGLARFRTVRRGGAR